LSPGRWAHCERTRRKADELARYYRLDVDPQQVALVTLLHDCAREAGPDELAAVLAADEVAAVDGGAANVGLLHGRAAARLVQRDLGIEDEAVLDAMTYHATGRHEPSQLLALQMVADLLEDGRPFLDAAPRPEAHATFPSLALACQVYRLTWCMTAGRPLADAAVQAYNWWVRRAA